MNPKQLEKIGVGPDSIKLAIDGIQRAAKDNVLRDINVKKVIKELVDSPLSFVDDKYFGLLASSIIEDNNFVRKDPVPYSAWGKVDDNVASQMLSVCSVPNTVKVALMADSHYCDPIPVGSVIALDNAISPAMVGPDISCMMRLSIIDMPVETLKNKFNLYKEAIERSTRFGIGPYAIHDKPLNHPVLEKDWNITRVTRENKDKAWKQLGSSGSSNHFCDIGIISFDKPTFNLNAGKYVAILTHSGSRGSGASVCDTYSTIAGRKRLRRYSYLNKLSWLMMDTEEGQEYWAAMTLMGEYASANHDVIHKLLNKNIGSNIIYSLENKHNFAFLEHINNNPVYVHRKGATPGGEGILGIIPGSMASPAFVVSGKGNQESISSASHGAGRLMSRRKAKELYNWKSVKPNIEAQGITILSAGVDESPYAYKNIKEVMEQQKDLVDIIARFDPKIVKMAEDTSGGN